VPFASASVKARPGSFSNHPAVQCERHRGSGVGAQWNRGWVVGHHEDRAAPPQGLEPDLIALPLGRRSRRSLGSSLEVPGVGRLVGRLDMEVHEVRVAERSERGFDFGPRSSYQVPGGSHDCEGVSPDVLPIP